MKKSILVIAGMAFSLGVLAQAKMYSAKEYARDGDMKKAIETINDAVNSESLKNSGDAWFTRGEIYEKAAEKDTSKALLEESAMSYMKVLTIKPGYDKDMIDPKLLRIATLSRNAGVAAYNDGKYDVAYNQFKKVVEIHDINGGKHFAGNKKFDTASAQALKFEGLCAFYAKKYDEALPVMIRAKENPISRDALVYSMLIDIYMEKNDNDNAVKTIDEAKAAYPKNTEIQRQEINYYSRTGKTDVLIKKLEEATTKDPNNSLLQYNLGVLYANMANPTDENRQPKTKPANAKELEAKAENAYKLAIDADPNKADYNFNLGVLYFNNAAEYTRQMNAIKGVTAADNKKYDDLKAQRTMEFTKALPYFQKSYDLLSPDVAKLQGDEATTYQGTLTALQNIYEVMGQSEKGDDITKKLEAFKNRK